ncbi:GIY-YIG nuclease family protein [Vibrio neonatus]|uniref:GIY-YIG nuclease family protein n=1 Tax=Vibrio neonatus TaxID=278860 RepID=UPI0021C2A034|nr:GIY-YIG nuclease family protein [Vibrio neonatus]
MLSDSLWSVYLIRTRHNALYCGVTNNLQRRFAQHVKGTGAKALRGKGPLILEWSTKVESKSLALKLEYKIKQLSKKQKESLVLDNSTLQLESMLCDIP